MAYQGETGYHLQGPNILSQSTFFLPSDAGRGSTFLGVHQTNREKGAIAHRLKSTTADLHESFPLRPALGSLASQLPPVENAFLQAVVLQDSPFSLSLGSQQGMRHGMTPNQHLWLPRASPSDIFRLIPDRGIPYRALRSPPRSEGRRNRSCNRQGPGMIRLNIAL